MLMLVILEKLSYYRIKFYQSRYVENSEEMEESINRKFKSRENTKKSSIKSEKSSFSAKFDVDNDVSALYKELEEEKDESFFTTLKVNDFEEKFAFCEYFLDILKQIIIFEVKYPENKESNRKNKSVENDSIKKAHSIMAVNLYSKGLIEKPKISQDEIPDFQLKEAYSQFNNDMLILNWKHTLFKQNEMEIKDKFKVCRICEHRLKLEEFIFHIYFCMKEQVQFAEFKMNKKIIKSLQSMTKKLDSSEFKSSRETEVNRKLSANLNSNMIKSERIEIINTNTEKKEKLVLNELSKNYLESNEENKDTSYSSQNSQIMKEDYVNSFNKPLLKIIKKEKPMNNEMYEKIPVKFLSLYKLTLLLTRTLNKNINPSKPPNTKIKELNKINEILAKMIIYFINKENLIKNFFSFLKYKNRVFGENHNTRLLLFSFSDKDDFLFQSKSCNTNFSDDEIIKSNLDFIKLIQESKIPLTNKEAYSTIQAFISKSADKKRSQKISKKVSVGKKGKSLFYDNNSLYDNDGEENEFKSRDWAKSIGLPDKHGNNLFASFPKQHIKKNKSMYSNSSESDCLQIINEDKTSSRCFEQSGFSSKEIIIDDKSDQNFSKYDSMDLSKGKIEVDNDQYLSDKKSSISNRSNSVDCNDSSARDKSLNQYIEDIDDIEGRDDEKLASYDLSNLINLYELEEKKEDFIEKNNIEFEYKPEERLLKKVSLNDFQYITNIGAGGYGKVDLYKKKITGDYYAIKSVNLQLMVSLILLLSLPKH